MKGRDLARGRVEHGEVKLLLAGAQLREQVEDGALHLPAALLRRAQPVHLGHGDSMQVSRPARWGPISLLGTFVCQEELVVGCDAAEGIYFRQWARCLQGCVLNDNMQSPV